MWEKIVNADAIYTPSENTDANIIRKIITPGTDKQFRYQMINNKGYQLINSISKIRVILTLSDNLLMVTKTIN